MKVKIIAEGSSKFERFIHRWGVSFLIGDDLLFDAFGAPGVLLNNMRKFNVDTGRIKRIVISHDDWDHIAGLWCLLSGRKDITVYICPGFQQEIKRRIASFGARVVEVEPFMEIEEGIFSSGQIEASCPGRVIFEQSLVIKLPEGLAIITGCAHPGIIDIIGMVKGHFQNDDVYSLLGGLHLKDNPREINAGIIEKLYGFGIRKIVPLHCTGRQATKMIRNRFGCGFMQAKEGGIIEL
jgi:7,8-dihydropterin-6-yl-methyl-4-(beta-D-ribofuranosyl)aminobenzene 5'-phosphate synthase